MKSPAFSYYQAKDLADAINIKKSDDDAVILAGGQSLLPTLNMRLSSPSVLIDIGSINELKKIKVEDSYLIMGAMCSHSQIMNNKEVNENLPILNKILSQVAHPAIRNKGTHGGSIAYGDPAAELPAFAVLTNAEIILSGSDGERIVLAKEFYKGLFETAINSDEILTSVKYPINQNDTKLFFDEVTRRHGDYAMAGLTGSIKQNNKINEEINLVFFEKWFDLISEFCSKVLPVSFGLFSLKSEVESVFIFFGSKSLISFNFPLLFVPISSFFIFVCI